MSKYPEITDGSTNKTIQYKTLSSILCTKFVIWETKGNSLQKEEYTPEGDQFFPTLHILTISKEAYILYEPKRIREQIQVIDTSNFPHTIQIFHKETSNLLDIIHQELEEMKKNIGRNSMGDVETSRYRVEIDEIGNINSMIGPRGEDIEINSTPRIENREYIEGPLMVSTVPENRGSIMYYEYDRAHNRPNTDINQTYLLDMKSMNQATIHRTLPSNNSLYLYPDLFVTNQGYENSEYSLRGDIPRPPLLQLCAYCESYEYTNCLISVCSNPIHKLCQECFR